MPRFQLESPWRTSPTPPVTYQPTRKDALERNERRPTVQVECERSLTQRSQSILIRRSMNACRRSSSSKNTFRFLFFLHCFFPDVRNATSNRCKSSHSFSAVFFSVCAFHSFSCYLIKIGLDVLYCPGRFVVNMFILHAKIRTSNRLVFTAYVDWLKRNHSHSFVRALMTRERTRCGKVKNTTPLYYSLIKQTPTHTPGVVKRGRLEPDADAKPSLLWIRHVRGSFTGRPRKSS